MINRGDSRHTGKAAHRVTYCLDRLEACGFNDGLEWETEIVPALTLEELVGALVAAEIDIEPVVE